MSAPKHETYFQFPLCALAYGASAKERLNAIICYSFGETGGMLWRRLSSEQSNAWAVDIRARKEIPKDMHWHDARHVAVLYGADKIKVQIYSMRNIVADHNAFVAFRNRFVHRHGTDAVVRLRSACHVQRNG